MKRATGPVHGKHRSTGARPAGSQGALAALAPVPALALKPAEAQGPAVSDHTVPLVPFTPIAALAPAAHAAPGAALDALDALDARQPGLAVLGAGDPRLTGWARTAIACTLTGTALGVVVDWRLGLAAAALAGGADSLYRARTSAVIPPHVRASSAQRRTRRRLARLGPFGYLSLHARAIPGTDAVIDHLIVGPGGIYAVSSEVWDRRLPVRATRGGGLFHGPLDQAARLEDAQWEAAEVSRLLAPALGQAVAVRPAMVIYGPAVPWIMIKINGVDVFCGRRLRKYLRREACGNRVRLDEQQTEALHEIAAQVFPAAGLPIRWPERGWP